MFSYMQTSRINPFEGLNFSWACHTRNLGRDILQLSIAYREDTFLTLWVKLCLKTWQQNIFCSQKCRRSDHCQPYALFCTTLGIYLIKKSSGTHTVFGPIIFISYHLAEASVNTCQQVQTVQLRYEVYFLVILFSA